MKAESIGNKPAKVFMRNESDPYGANACFRRQWRARILFWRFVIIVAGLALAWFIYWMTGTAHAQIYTITNADSRGGGGYWRAFRTNNDGLVYVESVGTQPSNGPTPTAQQSLIVRRPDAWQGPNHPVNTKPKSVSVPELPPIPPPVIPVPPTTNVYKIPVQWDDTNPPGLVDHYLLSLWDTNPSVPIRIMTVSGTSNQVYYLSPTNRYTLRCQCVDIFGLASDYSLPLVWRPDVVQTNTVSVLNGSVSVVSVPLPASGAGFYRSQVQSNQVLLLNVPGLNGPWSAVANAQAQPGAIYTVGITRTNNWAWIKAQETPQ